MQTGKFLLVEQMQKKSPLFIIALFPGQYIMQKEFSTVDK